MLSNWAENTASHSTKLGFVKSHLPSYLYWLVDLVNSPHFWINLFAGLSIGSLIILVVFIYLQYRKVLNFIKGSYIYLEIKPTDNTLKSPLSTNQLFTALHSLENYDNSGSTISFELVSTKHKGIRFLLRILKDDESAVRKSLLAYLPGIEITKVSDYIPFDLNTETKFYIQTQEFKFKKSYPYSLQEQDALNQSDSIAYLTSHMTKLQDDEIVALQLIAKPINKKNYSHVVNDIDILKHMILSNIDITPEIHYRSLTIFGKIFEFILWFIPSFALFTLLIPFSFLSWLFLSSKNDNNILPEWVFKKSKAKYLHEVGTNKQQLNQTVGEKINQSLFSVTIRYFSKTQDKSEGQQRLRGILSAFGMFSSYSQSLVLKHSLIPFPKKLAYFQLIHRLSLFENDPILSVSELSSLYHLPYTETTKTEDLLQVKSPELPAPLSLKNNSFDVEFGINTYGGTVTQIGLTKQERTGHFYIIGQTRSGKSNLMLQMLIQDVQSGKGVILIDPHGDLAKALINFIPDERINDFIYFAPRDIKHPIGINLLELSKISDEDELELEKDIVAEGAITVLRKVFSNDFSKGASNAFRIESLLRKSIHTAFYTEEPTLFSIFDLLNNPDFRGKALTNITDPRLLDFWRKFLDKAGDYQQFKMESPVNDRIDRFIFSPILKRIMEQKKSTINFDDILNKQKLLICNLAKGEITEDISIVLGTLILTKIRQAAEKRALIEPEDRIPIYLYVDEFQNFATPSFMRMLSELGKFGINITVVEQSTSQQVDRTQTEILLANVGNVITFKTANPIDEDLMLRQLSPDVKEGEIPNLPRYHFFMKKGAVEPEKPFSGQTEQVIVKIDKDRVERFINASRKNWTIVYKKSEPALPPVSNASNKLKVDDKKNSDKPQQTDKNRKETKKEKQEFVKKSGYLS